MSTDDEGRRALHLAAGEGYKDVVALLLDKGADVAATDNRGRTALHGAARGGHKDVHQGKVHGAIVAIKNSIATFLWLL